MSIQSIQFLFKILFDNILIRALNTKISKICSLRTEELYAATGSQTYMVENCTHNRFVTHTSMTMGNIGRSTSYSWAPKTTSDPKLLSCCPCSWSAWRTQVIMWAAISAVKLPSLKSWRTIGPVRFVAFKLAVESFQHKAL